MVCNHPQDFLVCCLEKLIKSVDREQKLREQNQIILDLKVQVENLSRDTDTRVHDKDKEVERLQDEIIRLNDEITTLNAQISHLEDHYQEYSKSVSENPVSSAPNSGMPAFNADDLDYHQTTTIPSPTTSSGSVYGIVISSIFTKAYILFLTNVYSLLVKLAIYYTDFRK